MCIGQHFALMEAQLVLAILTERVELTLESDKAVKPRAELTLRPSGPVPAVVHRRRALHDQSEHGAYNQHEEAVVKGTGY